MSIYPNPLFAYLSLDTNILESQHNNRPPLINLSRSQNNKLTTQLPLTNSSFNNSINIHSLYSSSITGPNTKVIINCNNIKSTKSDKSNIHYVRTQPRVIKIVQNSSFILFYQFNFANRLTQVFTHITITMDQSKSSIQIKSPSKLYHR